MEQAWAQFCSTLERRVGAQNMEIWIRPALRPEQIGGQRIQLRVESRYHYDWIKDNLLLDIEQAWKELVGPNVAVELLCEGLSSTMAMPAVPSGPRPSTRIDPNMTFENFVVGKCNEFAHAAACAVADDPGRAHNPLFIYGETGLGKTHLAHAIGNRVAARNKGVAYYQSNQFFDQMVRSLQNRSIADFRKQLQTEVDVLLLDDVQFLAGRDRTEEELFYLFEMMKAEGRQIVLTADEPPRSIGKLEPRLRTRFEGGLLADVQPPDTETMMAIVAQKSEAMALFLPTEVQYQIALHVRASVREMEGVLNRLKAMANHHQRPVTMASVQHFLGDLVPPMAPPPTAEQIINRIAEHYHLRPTDIRGNRRPANIANPRQMAMFLTRKLTNLSFPEIGREFGRDNSTVQYACRKVEEQAQIDPNLRAEIDLLERLCRAS